MRALIIARAKLPVPPEMLPMMVEGFIGWRERYRSGVDVRQQCGYYCCRDSTIWTNNPASTFSRARSTSLFFEHYR